MFYFCFSPVFAGPIEFEEEKISVASGAGVISGGGPPSDVSDKSGGGGNNSDKASLGSASGAAAAAVLLSAGNSASTTPQQQQQQQQQPQTPTGGTPTGGATGIVRKESSGKHPSEGAGTSSARERFLSAFGGGKKHQQQQNQAPSPSPSFSNHPDAASNPKPEPRPSTPSRLSSLRATSFLNLFVISGGGSSSSLTPSGAPAGSGLQRDLGKHTYKITIPLK